MKQRDTENKRGHPGNQASAGEGKPDAHVTLSEAPRRPETGRSHVDSLRPHLPQGAALPLAKGDGLLGPTLAPGSPLPSRSIKASTRSPLHSLPVHSPRDDLSLSSGLTLCSRF